MSTRRFNWLKKPMFAFSGLLGTLALCAPALAAKPLIHDGEYYFVEAQHKQAWAKEDKAMDKRLADIRKANGGKRPANHGARRTKKW